VKRLLRAVIAPVSASFALGSATLALCCAGARAEGPATAILPPWLNARAGVLARVDEAPWFDSDEPEAALTASASSLHRDFSTHPERPADIVYRPIGVEVRIVAVLGGGVAQVRGSPNGWTAYTLLDRLVPDIPAGTTLRVAGGFGGFADFFPALTTPERKAERIATGSNLEALANAAAPYDPDASDLVRVQVRVLGGPQRGRVGWLATSYTGLPADRVPSTASVTERACTCRLIRFGNS